MSEPLVNDSVDGTVINTAYGSLYDLSHPQTWDGSWEDIAQGLANTCRFGGQIPFFYSVAEHSVRVCQIVREGGYPPPVQLAALVHDAHEAFYGDVVKPLKPLVPTLVDLMRLFDLQVERRLGLDEGALAAPAVKDADHWMLLVEAGVLWRPPPPWAASPTVLNRALVSCWPPHIALDRFESALADLCGAA